MTAPTFPKVLGPAGSLVSSLKGLYYENVTTLGQSSSVSTTVQGECLSLMRWREFSSRGNGVSTRFSIYYNDFRVLNCRSRANVPELTGQKRKLRLSTPNDSCSAEPGTRT